MAETSYPVAGGGGITDATYEQLMAGISGNGRVAYRPSANTLAQPMMYADSTGRQVKIRANVAYLLRGFRWESGSSTVVRPLDANTSGQPRVDLGVLRLDREDFTVRFEIIKGSPAANPVTPAVTQQTGTTGLFEVPVGAVRVTSSATAGLPSIASSDVTPMETWLAPPNTVAHSSRRGAVDPGGLFTEYDTNRTYVGLGSRWHLIGEDGSWTTISPAGGWDTDAGDSHIRARRRNGYTYFQCTVQMTGSDKAAGTDLTVCTLPSQFRPTHGLDILGWLDGANLCRVIVDAGTGRVYMRNYSVPMRTGAFLICHSATWASN